MPETGLVDYPKVDEQDQADERDTGPPNLIAQLCAVLVVSKDDRQAGEKEDGGLVEEFEYVLPPFDVGLSIGHEYRYRKIHVEQSRGLKAVPIPVVYEQ